MTVGPSRPIAPGPGIAVVGCGSWGMNHVRVWHDMGHLVLACDPDPVRLAALAELFPGVRTCSQFDDVLEDPSVHGVVLATPASTHAELGVLVVSSGRDLLVEKPLATNVPDGEELLGAASTSGRIVMVGHVLEYHPAFVRLRKLVSEDVLGRLLYGYSNRLNFGRVRTEENAMWSFAPHDLALFMRIAGTEPSEVSCRGGSFLGRDIADVSMMNLAFPSGMLAHVFVSWLHPFKEQRFVLVGDRQMAVFDDTEPWDRKLVLYPQAVKWVDGRLPVTTKAGAVPVPVSPAEPLTVECQAFVDAMATRKTPLTDAESGARVLRVLEAGERSLAQRGSPISLGRRPASPPRADSLLFGNLGTARPFIHPTAIVDENARVGPRTRIWHFSHVMPEAHIGADCSLGQNVFVGRGVEIGNHCKIQNNVSLYEGVRLDDDVFCGPSVVFTNVHNPRAAVNRRSEFRPTTVRRGATLGANCTVLCGHTIGEYGFVAAGAVVTKDVLPYALVLGAPAIQVGWACQCGSRLPMDNSQSTCGECGRVYREQGGILEHVPAMSSVTESP